MSSVKAQAIGAANAVLRHVDAAIVRRSRLRVPSHADLLARVQALGLQPTTAVDVGAAAGEWTLACHAAFPNLRHVFVEPLSEFEPDLEAITRQLPGSFFVRGAAAERRGTAAMNVHADLVGSSMLHEAEGGATDGEPRTVPTVAIDDLIQELALEPPFIIKVDTQGSELRVLDGAQQALMSADLVILETSLFPFFEGGPLLDVVISYMGSRGFVAYDIFGPSYRPLDGALAQVDLAFVPEGSPLRKDSRYATAEQRKEQNERIRAGIAHRSSASKPTQEEQA